MLPYPKHRHSSAGQSTAAPPPRRLGRRATIGASWPPAPSTVATHRPGLPTSRSSRQTDGSVFPVSVPVLSASPESSRCRPSSTKSTASHPCFVSGGAASQRPLLHRALLDPTASPKAQSAAAFLRPRRPPAGGRRQHERRLLKLSARLRPRPRLDPPDLHRHAKSRSLTPPHFLPLRCSRTSRAAVPHLKRDRGAISGKLKGFFAKQPRRRTTRNASRFIIR
ncbi:uncharacterized protein LOC119326749 [Triticum dicoccoides]|uniref:uncharacterized protein LOC119326749 n=1 Tax=Triticum dicoccoides TaxID=85692 RepID=UPI001890F7B8|nr:uncharacterized protein LOC119326749 [Triticum dicoccoides]